jgi:hypothetical protein
MRKTRKDKGKKRRRYKCLIRQRLHNSKPISVCLKYDVEAALRERQQETGQSNSEIINNILRSTLCDTEDFLLSEIKRVAGHLEALKYKFKVRQLSKGVVIKNV